MTTLQPREPYTAAELQKLYPQGLQLQQVQILLRHGERTPVSSRFKNAGLPANWPYCQSAADLKSVILTADHNLDTLGWKRRMEGLGPSDTPLLATGPKGEIDSICQAGELTNRGRETTLALGQRIRRLYVDDLGFLPKTLSGSEVALRSTPIQRALESVQQAYTGLYSPAQRAPGLPLPPIVTRAMQDETLFPNEGACKRFAELARAFADRAAKVWNDTPEMAYINKKIGKWMPPLPGDASGKPQPVKVDSHPRLTGIMDTTNATHAHGPATKLPSEFYDQKVRDNTDRICTEEWFAGYQESNEYRKLGIGGLVGDLTQRMVEHATEGPSTTGFKMSLSGCHDTTLASTLTALGAFDVSRDKWPNFTSSIAFELFKHGDDPVKLKSSTSGAVWPSKEKTWWYSLFSSPKAATTARTPLSELPQAEQDKLDGYYVRLRYNDKPVTIPHCRSAGNHLVGDESFCTLRAFKEAADSFTPKDWKAECKMNLGQSAFRPEIERPKGL